MNNDIPHLPIYMDYSATTPVDPRVVDKMIPYLREQFGNPASRSHQYGWDAERADLGRNRVGQPRDQGRRALLQKQGKAPHHGEDRA
jgi:hypothetical protein